MVTAADVHTNLAFLKKASSLHHRRFIVSGVRDQASFHTVVHDHTFNRVGKALACGFTLGLCARKWKNNQTPQVGDENNRDGMIEIIYARLPPVSRDAQAFVLRDGRDVSVHPHLHVTCTDPVHVLPWLITAERLPSLP